MTNPTLEHLIKDISTDGIIKFFRERSIKFSPKKESLDDYNDDAFKAGIKVGEIKFNEIEELVICSFLSETPLSERSGKKAQYEKAKKVLKDRVSDAGIFIFYDKGGNFRFSLVYTNYQGPKKDWSTYRRFTYFVSKESTNKTFLQRIGEADFSTLEKIQDAFSVEKVTKEFYENISYWYFWAVKKCVFPKDAEAEENGRNIAVIRLITRIIFVWFMRERKLIRKELFEKDTIDRLLNDTSKDSSSYYQAILQNLFFATLSTKQDERQFRSELRGPKGFNPDHGNPYVFRFQSYLADTEKVCELFVDIPFLNGGLFDCLDDSDKGIYIDGFSETKKNQAMVPNELFFGKETKVDLSGDLGAQQKNCIVRGLINLLSEFNFTIDENTIDDKDVALDPELLGRVFENLLASFNPETSSTARKATGSYYTPREIVDYMVDESLKGYLTTHLSKIEEVDDKLANLFSQGVEDNPFTVAESKRIVNLIESVRVVDPAVGSGAFPMGILNRLVFLLHKVDPDNGFWKQEQINAANQITDPRIRQETIDRIETYFEKNDNYGRKLFLIQKCIYGVDIQQIAVEIAKLRFFISLLVDEDVDKNKPNWGIEPLPNLDFKIMQGNSLVSEFLGFDFDASSVEDNSDLQFDFDFDNEENSLIKQLEQRKTDFQNESDKARKSTLRNEIEKIMIRLFEHKLEENYRDFKTIVERAKNIPGAEKRNEYIAQEKVKAAKKYGFDLENIEKQLKEFISKKRTRPFFSWKLYFAEVFEKGGFDIVIGNPPYIDSENMVKTNPEQRAYLAKKFTTTKGNWDIYIPFWEKTIELCNEDGIATLITPNKWLSISYGKMLRLLAKKYLYHLVDYSKFHAFDNTGVFAVVAFMSKSEHHELQVTSFIDKEKIAFDLTLPIDMLSKFESWGLFLSKELPIIIKLLNKSKKLSDLSVAEEAFTVSEAYLLSNIIVEKSRVTQEHFNFINTGTIDPYSSLWGLKQTTYLKKKYDKPVILMDEMRQRFPKRFIQSKDMKIIISGIRHFESFLDEKGLWVAGKSTVVLRDFKTSPKYLLGILNSKLITFYLKESYGSLSMDGGINFSPTNVSEIPIRGIENPDEILKIVDQILISKTNEPAKNIEKQKAEIDKLVYQIYGLSDAEIDVVERTVNYVRRTNLDEGEDILDTCPE